MEKVEQEFKRICESTWYKEIELEGFEMCPICQSKSYHKVVRRQVSS